MARQTQIPYRVSPNQPRIGLDLDGVLADCSDGWKGSLIIGEPIPAGVELLKALHGEGYAVVIFTSRTSRRAFLNNRVRSKTTIDRIIKRIKSWFRQNHLDQYVHCILPYDKPFSLIIDDRALRFDGNAKTTLRAVREFKPWWESNHVSTNRQRKSGLRQATRKNR